MEGLLQGIENEVGPSRSRYAPADDAPGKGVDNEGHVDEAGLGRDVLDQHRSTQRKVPGAADDEAALTEAIIELARQYGRYGYRRITALLRSEGWQCNHKRVERIWRREGLRVPARQPKRGRL